MENHNQINASDYIRCIVKLRKREAKDGLLRDRKSGLMRDYSLPKYDNDPLVIEYRQLRGIGKYGGKKGGGDESPIDPSESSREQGTLDPWFTKRGDTEER